MFLGTVTGWTSALNTDVPFATKINSNAKVTNTNGLISLNRTGLWNVDTMLVVTGVTGNVSAQIYADGVADPTAIATDTIDTSGTATLNITDAVRTVVASYPNVGQISVRLSVASATVTGQIRVEYVQ